MKPKGKRGFFSYVNFSDGCEAAKVAEAVSSEVRRALHESGGKGLRVFGVTSGLYNESAVVLTNDPEVATKSDAVKAFERKLAAVYGP